MSANADLRAALIAMLCVTAVTTMDVASPGLWTSGDAVFKGAHASRTALKVFSHLGTLGAAVVACFVPVRVLGAIAGGGYSSLMVLASVVEQPSEKLLLPLSALSGALGICVWALFFELVLALERHLRNALVLANGLLSGLVYLLALGGLSPLLVSFGQRSPSVVAALLAVLVAMAVLLGRANGPQVSVSPQSTQPQWLKPVLALFLLAVPIRVVSAAVSLGVVDPLDVAFHPSLQSLAALFGQGGLLGLVVWLGIRRPATTTPTVVCLGLCVGAGLTPVFVLSSPALHRCWGPAAAFVAALGSSVASVSTTLLLVLAMLLSPCRFLPIILGCWLMTDGVASHLGDLCVEWARGDTIRVIALTVAASLIMTAGAVVTWRAVNRKAFGSN